MTKKNFYITTPVYYTNGYPHLGHAYSTFVADILARYKRLAGYDVFFLTGTDEHGQKVSEAAVKKGVKPEEFVNNVAEKFSELWKKLDISYTKFIRTTNKHHVKVVQSVFNKLQDAEDIKLGEYKGWYCQICEEFVVSNNNKQPKSCPQGHTDLKLYEEKSYLLQVQKYTKRLQKLLDPKNKFLLPDSRSTELLNNFVNHDLQNLSITRSSVKWAIPVERDPENTIYVWFDALINYLSGIDYENPNSTLFNQFFNKDTQIVQILGKEITRFHAIYWPVILMGLKLRLPNKLIAHGWLITNSGKMSKSLHNTADPYLLLDKYGSDTIRFYFAHELDVLRDNKYDESYITDSYNSYLVNDISNLFYRSITMLTNYFGGELSPITKTDQVDTMFKLKILNTIKSYQLLMDQYEITKATKLVANLAKQANKYIEVTKPWSLHNKDNDKVNTCLNLIINCLVVITVLLSPILTKSSATMAKQLNIDLSTINFDDLTKLNFGLRTRFSKPTIIFKRIQKNN